MWSIRPAARTALVQFQFTLWRLSRVQRTRFEIWIRSRQNYSGLVQTAPRRRAAPRLRLSDHEAHSGVGRVRARLRSFHAIRKLSEARPEFNSIRLSAQKRRCLRRERLAP